MRKSTLFKKTLLLAMSVVIVLTAAGCKKEEKAESTLKMSEANSFPIVEEKAELSAFIPQQAMIADLETNEFTKWLEEKTNVHINWDIASGDTAQAISLRIASGDLPDIFMNAGFSDIQVFNYGEEGLFIDLTDYIDKYTCNLKEILAEREDIKKNITQDGKIYGLFSGGDMGSSYAQNRMWVYEPWLEKLGLELPETTEDFYNMLKAFKEQDPNGNGKADEVALGGRGVVDNWGIANYLMNSFVYCDGSASGKWLFVEDGKVKYSPVEDGFREGLRYIKKLYDDGLLLKDVFVIDRTRLTALGENEDAPLLGACPGLWAGMFTISGSDSKRIYDYVTIPPLEGPSGIRQTPNTYSGVIPTYFVVTKDCEYPELAIRWADTFYDSEVSMKMKGVKGYREAKEGEIGIGGSPALFAYDPVPEEDATNFGSVQNANWGEHLGFSYTANGTLGKTKLLDGDLNGVMYLECENKYKKYLVDGKYPNIPIDIDDAAEYEDLKETLNETTISYFAEFVTGKRDVDKDWDSYVKEMKNNGVTRFLELAQNRYDKYAN